MRIFGIERSTLFGMMVTDDNLHYISVLPWDFQGDINYIPWNNLVSVLSEGYYFIALWNKRQMNIFRVLEGEVRSEALSALKSAVQFLQDVSFPEEVSQVFEWTGTLFLLTTSGLLKVLIDLNDSTKRSLLDGSLCFRTIYSVSPPKKVLKACPLIRNVLLLSTVLNGCITVDIYNVDTLSGDMEIFLVDSLILEKQEPQVGNASVVMCKCSANIASHLMGTQSDNYTVMLMGLNSGSIYWLPFINNLPTVPKARKLYHAGRKVLGVISPEGRNDVFVLLDGGVMIVITCSNTKDKSSQDVGSSSKSLKFDIVALPASIREICVPADPRNILCSDGTRCWLVKLSTDEVKPILLPLTGVTGILAVPESDTCVVTTKHNTVYTVTLTCDLTLCCEKSTPSTQQFCDLETPSQYICELKEKTNDLLLVEKALQVEDSVFSAIAAASRGDILQESFSGRVLVYNVDYFDPFNENAHDLPTDNLYKLFIEVKNNSSISFSASMWNMCISILTHDDGVLSKTVPLPSAFIRETPFSTNVFIPLHSKDLASGPKLLVNLIANLPEPDTARWMSIPVVEERLDLSYFASVISDAKKNMRQTKASPIYEQINNRFEKTPVDRQPIVRYSMTIPPHLRDLTALMPNLLSKCKHRCEDFLKQIKGGIDQRDFGFLLGDAFVSITFSRTISVLTISSNSTEMVHGVKSWIIRCLSSPEGDSSAAPDIGSRAKWLRTVLEKEEMKSSVHVENLKDIHSEVRNNVSAGLPL